MGPNHRIEGEHSLQDVKCCESFYKWFLEVESKLSGKSVDCIHEELSISLITPTTPPREDGEEDEEDELPFDLKRRLEKVKKYLTDFSNSDALLENAEDERVGSDFSWRFSALETFSVLGGITFFNCYLKNGTEAKVGFDKLVKFLDKYEKISRDSGTDFLSGMKSVVFGLKDFCQIQLGDCIDDLVKDMSELDGTLDDKFESIVSGIKNYFLSGLQSRPGQDFLKDQVTLVDQIILTHPGIGEWYLNRYNLKRSIRLQNSVQSSKKFPTDEENSDAESGLTFNPTNPWNILGACQFLTDFLAAHGPSQLAFGNSVFKTHSEIITFIQDSAKEVCEAHPTFLRGHFTFAEIFANELPITRQDKDFAKSLLNKALSTNLMSSKIHHKTSLCLLKSRQFAEAKKHITKAVELDPSNAPAYYTLVKLLLRDPTGMNKDILDNVLNVGFPRITEILGPESQLPFWKAAYFFITGEKDLAVEMWVEIILEFYVNKPELDLDTVLPFQELPEISSEFFWTRSPLTLQNTEEAVRGAISKEKTRRRVVLNRLLDLIIDPTKSNTI